MLVLEDHRQVLILEMLGPLDLVKFKVHRALSHQIKIEELVGGSQKDQFKKDIFLP